MIDIKQVIVGQQYILEEFVDDEQITKLPVKILYIDEWKRFWYVGYECTIPYSFKSGAFRVYKDNRVRSMVRRLTECKQR